MKSKYQTIILFALLCLIACGILYFLDKRQEEKLLISKHETVATVEKVEPFIGNSGLRVWYLYRNEAGKTFKNYYRLFIDSKNLKAIEPLLKGKRIPVIYDSTNEESSFLLLSQSDFKHYGITQPDSILQLSALITKLQF